jgi:signal transduction histidine kinase
VLLEEVLEWRKASASSRQDEGFTADSLVKDARTVMTALFAGRRIDFVTEVRGSAAGRYSGDARRIRQIMMILLQNASKYGREGGTQ